MSNVVSLLRKEVAPKRRMPTRRPNAELRTREHLTGGEVEKLIEAARGNRWAHRDATMILIAYRHGLRASELVDLRWDQVHFTSANLDVRRRKAGTPATHPLTGLELRALRRLKREQEPSSPFVFISERGAPFSGEGFARLLQRAGKAADDPSSSAHAPARLRLQAGQRRPGHAGAAGLPRPQKHPAHRALHRVVAEPVQRVLERLKHVRSGHVAAISVSSKWDGARLARTSAGIQAR